MDELEGSLIGLDIGNGGRMKLRSPREKWVETDEGEDPKERVCPGIHATQHSGRWLDENSNIGNKSPSYPLDSMDFWQLMCKTALFLVVN